MNYSQQQQMPVAVPPPAPPQQQQQALTAEQRQYALMVQKQEQALKAAQQKRDFNDRRSRIRDMLDYPKKHMPVVINGLDEYLAMDAAYKSLSNRGGENQEKVSMDGFPVTDADRAVLVAELTAAIMDFSNIVDKPMKRQTTRNAPVVNSAVKAVKNLSTFEVQLLAWKIMCAICDAHRGVHNVPSWTNVWKYNSYDSFRERFRDVRHAVARCKALIKSILDTDIPFAKRLAAGPRAEFKMKRENSETNDRRAAEREGMKKRKPDDAGLDGEEVAAPNDLIFQSNDGARSHDGNMSTGGNEILDNHFDSPSVGGQASSLDFGADHPGGMDGATNKEDPVDLWSYRDHTFAQASTEFGMGDFGSQASGLQPAAGDPGVNANMSSGPGNTADLHNWDFQVPGGYDAESNDILDAFDLLRELSPGLRLTLATLGESVKTQQQDQIPSAMTPAEDSLNTDPGDSVPAEPASTSQDPQDQVEHDRIISGEED
ncbi:hypothetical protein SLS64_013993 [Diaporthe eres]